MSGNSRLRCSEITKLRHDIVDVEQAVGKGDGELVDLTSEDHVAEVDQAADVEVADVAVADVAVADVGAGGAGGRVLVDEHVVVVGVVVHDRAAQHRQQWHHALAVPAERGLDDGTIIRVGDAGGPRSDGLRGIEVPQEVGLVCGRVTEAVQPLRHAAHEPPQLVAQVRGLRHGCIGGAAHERDRAQQVALVLHDAGRQHAGKRQRGVDGCQVLQRSVLQFQRGSLLRFVGDLHHVIAHLHVLVALAVEIAQRATDAEVLAGESCHFVVGEGGLR